MLSSLHHRKIAAAALAVATLTAAACGDDDDDIGAVSGTYTLTGVSTVSSGPFLSPNGYTFQSGGSTYAFTTGTLTLEQDGEFQLSVNGTRQPAGTSTTTPVTFAGTAGTWTQSGATVVFDPTPGGATNFNGTLVDGGDEMRVPVEFTGAGGGTYYLRFEQD